MEFWQTKGIFLELKNSLIIAEIMKGIGELWKKKIET